MGADAAGVARLGPVDDLHSQKYTAWINSGQNAGMSYLERNQAVRFHPGSEILPDARSVIVVAVSYYPRERQRPDAPQVSKYAYGQDYHLVLKKYLEDLGERIDREVMGHSYRPIVDTVPFLERYWAEVAGLGFIGRNRNLIVPKVGSYVFLGELLTTLDLEPTRPARLHSCGTCSRCLDSCPTQALTSKGLDARRCVSYLTIEHRGDIPSELAKKFGRRFYGCDTCQDVCPYNHRPLPQRLFAGSGQILALSSEDMADFSTELYSTLTKNSAMSRAKFFQLKRNADLFVQNNPELTTDKIP